MLPFKLPAFEASGPSLSPSEIMDKMEEYCDGIMDALCSHQLPNGWQNKSPVEAAIQVSICSMLYELQVKGSTCTLRDLYYRISPHVSVTQEHTNSVLHAFAMGWKVPRHALNVFASSKGYLAGCIRIRGVDCTRSGIPCAAIPGDLKEEDIEILGARHVIVIEKDCIFQRIINPQQEDANGRPLWDRLPCVIVTGCGFPDFATRGVVATLSARGLPCYGLVDYNPSGVRILMTYRSGSMKSLRLAGQRAITPIQWLGLHRRTLEEHPSMPRAKLTTREERLKEGVLRAKHAEEEIPRSWYEEVRLMTYKAELQSLYESSYANLPGLSPIASFIEQQILMGFALK